MLALASPDFEPHTEFIEQVPAVLVVPHRHLEFLLDVSPGLLPVELGSSAPAHQSGQVVTEHESTRLSVLSQVGSEEGEIT